jgi:hypothetical protein
MALKYLNRVTGDVVTVAEPREVAAAEDNEHRGRYLAMHQRRTLERMDASTRWERVTDEPAAQPAAADSGESEDAGEPTRPQQKYPKQPWVDWAVDTGRLSREDADAMTVDDLMALD